MRSCIYSFVGIYAIFSYLFFFDCRRNGAEKRIDSEESFFFFFRIYRSVIFIHRNLYALSSRGVDRLLELNEIERGGWIRDSRN